MALKENKAPKIHHSDRGSQYTYKSYIDLLKANTTIISMALSAQDNAYAERINRTIKEEYLDHWKPRPFISEKAKQKEQLLITIIKDHMIIYKKEILMNMRNIGRL